MASTQPAHQIGQASQRTGIGHLPVELLHVIFGHFHRDRETITACSCVCRQWRAVALPYVFAELEMGHQELDNLTQSLDTFPHLPQYVEKLLIYVRPRAFGSTQLEGSVPLVYNTLVELLSRLSSLKYLELLRLPLPDGPLDEAAVALAHGMYASGVTRLQCLSLEGCYRYPARIREHLSVQTILSITEMLSPSELRLYNTPIDCSPLAGVDDVSAPGRLRIKSLSGDELYILPLSGYPDEDTPLLDTLSQRLALHCLHTLQLGLRIRTSRRESLRAVGDFLHHAGGDTLRHLSLPFILKVMENERSDDTPGYWQDLRLSSLRGLTSFSMQVYLPVRYQVINYEHPPPTAYRRDGSLDYVPRIPMSAVCTALLATLPQTVRVLTIVVSRIYETKPLEDDRVANLDALDAFLAGPQLPHLNTAHIVLDDVFLQWRAPLNKCIAAVRKVMTRSAARGILHIHSKRLFFHGGFDPYRSIDPFD
ncbi:hypothetical protein BN946_scf184569.g46 [Trametes cinnabarina]|uniref:F-box domain-containing protein n=1 Tax=Pycnoporus cinnabarinus TaxID=5643 RepID=A0A060SDM3_PYCCI|nr:hypothetical protein BN946_scf184569.g46 [Trametes cinnabarina]